MYMKTQDYKKQATFSLWNSKVEKLKELSIKLRTTMSSLIEEAIDLLAQQKGK